jgi:para-nitrobenzyl esterase
MDAKTNWVPALILGLAIGGLSPAAQASDDTFVATAGQAVVRVTQGQLMGFRERGIYTFRGVPYAKAARFMPPEAPDGWSGVRLAMSYGEICPVPDQTTVSLDEQFNAHRYFPQNENCQFLNIWTPGLDGAKRPVLVFIHGGGFTNGSSIEGEGYDGRNLAELGDLVVVNLNHRLNVLGTLDLSAYGTRYAQASNAGMRDIVAALKWLNANIAQFGGDPRNVTIMGQSGGGGKVRVLMGIPEARDLFAKSIVMSGVGSNAAYPKALGTAVAKYTVQNLGLNAKTIDKIATVPYPVLLAAGEKAMKQVEKDGLATAVSWRPTIDGSFVPADPVQDGWAKYSADKPFLIGNVLEEMNTVIRNNNTQLFADNWRKWTDAEAMQKLAARYGNRAAAIAAEWSKIYPRDPLARALFFADANRSGTLAAADFKARSGRAPVFVYLYKWDPPVLDGVAGAWHVSDVHMALFNTDLLPQSFGGGEGARSVSYEVARAWINFVRRGNPNHSGLPDWPAFTPQNHATLLFDDYSTVGINHDQTLLELITKPN